MSYYDDEQLLDVELKGGLIDTSHALKYILAGNSVLTFVNIEKNTHVTFRVKQNKKKKHIYYVSALNGPNNMSHYKFFASIYAYEGKAPVYYFSDNHAKISRDTTSVKAFEHIFSHLVAGHIFKNLEIWHSSHCCRCGRFLTVQSSIAAGMGPYCGKFFPDIKPETKIPDTILDNYLTSI